MEGCVGGVFDLPAAVVVVDGFPLRAGVETRTDVGVDVGDGNYGVDMLARAVPGEERYTCDLDSAVEKVGEDSEGEDWR